MNISRDSITHLASKGHLTLQVPTFVVYTDDVVPDGEDGMATTGELMEVPDDWFIYLSSNRPVIGRESGFLHLTRAGYEAFKDDIKVAFEAWIVANPEGRGPGTTTWADFEKHAKQHFAGVKKTTAVYKRNLRAKLSELIAMEKKL